MQTLLARPTPRAGGPPGHASAVRAAPYDPQLPGESAWTLGYLFDVIHTRDPWMHRIDICRPTGTAPLLTPEHDGRLLAEHVPF